MSDMVRYYRVRCCVCRILSRCVYFPFCLCFRRCICLCFCFRYEIRFSYLQTRLVPNKIDPLFTLKFVPVPVILPTLLSKQSTSVSLPYQPVDIYLVFDLH